MDYVDEIEIIIKDKDFDPKGKVLIGGFHSALGECGYILIRHLVAQEGVKPIGYIISPLVPPHVFLGDGRLLLPIELYSYDRFILLFTRLQPHRAEWTPFTVAIAEWAQKNGLQEALLLGGLDIQFATDDSKFRCAPTTAYRKKAEEQELPILEDGRGIYGPLALLLASFEIRDFPAVAVLPYAQRGRPDPRAASVAIEVLNKLYNLDVSIEELMQDADTIENEIKQLLERQREREPDRDLGGMFA